MNSLVLGFRNTFRNLIRSGSIVIILGLVIGLSLSMLVARQAVGQKIESVKASVGNTIIVSPAGFRGFSGNGNALTTGDMDKVQHLDHVSSVAETLSDRLNSSDTNLESAIEFGNLGRRFDENSGGTSMNTQAGPMGGGNFTPPVQAVGTTDPSALDSSVGGGTVKITSGEAFAAGSSDNVAIVGQSLASKNSLKVGSTFTAHDTTIKVIGIYDAGNTFANGLVIFPLKTLQTLSDQAGSVTGAVVTVDSIEDVPAVTSAIQKALGDAADVQSQQDQIGTTISSLENVKKISTISLIGSLIAGAVIILLTMVMIVRERRREIGVLKAIGASNTRVIGQFMTEAITLTIAGALIGVVIGAAGSNPVTNMLVSSNTAQTTSARPLAAAQIGSGGSSAPSTADSGRRQMRSFVGRNADSFRSSLDTIHASAGWSVLAYGFGAAILIAAVGSALAGWMIACVRPSEVMRTE